MSEKTILKSMRCPECGAPLKAKDSTETITCVYCGNSVVPVAEVTPVTQNENTVAFNGVLKVEGIKTSSSALAYIEQFFEEYDWEAFSYAQTLSIVEIDKLASSLKASSADDKNTWVVCFKAISVPFIHKIEGCNQILCSVIDEYKKDNLDAYSKFDAYKRIASMISSRKNNIVANLEKIVSNAAKYGATATEVSDLKSNIDNIKNLANIDLYGDVEAIPAVKTFIAEKNAKIVEELAAAGIDAEREYEIAKALIDKKKYVEALNALLSLKGYADTNLLIDKIDKYFLISDVLEIEGNLYFFKKDSSEYGTLLSLYPSENGKISDKAIIRNITKIVTNYADVLYYLDGSKKLKKHNLSTKKEEEEVYDKSINEKSIFVYNRRVFLLANSGDYYGKKHNIIELDLAKGTIRVLVDNVKEIVSLTGNKMIYTVSRKVVAESAEDSDKKTYDVVGVFNKQSQKNDESDSGIKDAKVLLENTKEVVSVVGTKVINTISEKVNSESNEGTEKTLTNIVNVDTMDVIELGIKNVSIEGFVGNYVVYTQVSPNEFNKNLYIKSLDSNEPEKLIEQNIFKFCDIIANKLFYYIGNSRNQSLINVNCDGTERREWPLYISEILFEQGGWIYFIRKSGYNSILCKSKLDGSKFSIIAADIEEFIEIKNGYLYYINDVSTLVKVRMDGSNLQELCDDVETVLAVKEDKIIFISVDDRIATNEFTQSSAKIVKSIYAVDFSGSGKIKLAYNIKSANTYDENTVYYIAAEEIKSSYDQLSKHLDMLYKLDVETNSVEKLLDLQIHKREEENLMTPFAIAMLVMVLTLFMAFIGFMAEAAVFGVISFIASFISLVVGIMLKLDSKE